MKANNDDGRPIAVTGMFRRGIGDVLSRRQVLRRAGALGLATSAIHASLAAPVSAAPDTSTVRRTVAAQADAKTLTLALVGSPVDLDPHSAGDLRSALANRGPYEQLIALKGEKTDEYVGLIAERWEANADKSVWTFHLRPGVTFQDGSPCDAEAVRASYERLLALGLGPVYAISRFLSDPGQITAPDERTVVFDLGTPQPLFEAALSSQYGPQIVNVAALMAHEEEGDLGHGWAQINAEGLGTGPYRIVEFEPGQLLVMERNEAYWGGWDGDHFDRIVLRVVPENATRRQLVEQGEVDIVDNLTPEDLQALEQNPDLVVDRSYSTKVEYFVLTVAGPLQDPKARQAMNYAFPYDEVIDGIYKGYGKRAIGPVAELTRGFAPGTFTYTTDLAKAKQLFAEAGVPEGTEITLMQESGDENVKTAAQLFQANLEQIGIRLAIQTVDSTAYVSTYYGDAPVEERPGVMHWFWWPDYNDAWNYLAALVSCEAWGSKGGNGGYYCNQRVEELLAQSRDPESPELYQQALAELQQLLSRDDPPAIYYMQPQSTTVLHKDIGGFVSNPIYIGTYDLYRLHRTA